MTPKILMTPTLPRRHHAVTSQYSRHLKTPDELALLSQTSSVGALSPTSKPRVALCSNVILTEVSSRAFDLSPYHCQASSSGGPPPERNLTHQSDDAKLGQIPWRETASASSGSRVAATPSPPCKRSLASLIYLRTADQTHQLSMLRMSGVVG